MKPILTLLAAAAVASAQDTAPAAKTAPAPAAQPENKTAGPALAPGSTVTPDAFGKMEWLQGEGPKTWEPGKVYIFECWATWCGPCIAAIPHVNELHKKYSDKGLRVHGINVWERTGRQPVVDFVKGKGDGMSYPVAYTTRGDAFDTGWLKPGGVTGIPHAFVVKDGKLILKTHPSQISDSVIEALLAGGDAQEKALGKIREAAEKQQQLSSAMREFQMASAKKDVEAMAKQLETIKAIDTDGNYSGGLELQLLIAREDWAGVESALTKLDDSPKSVMTLINSSRPIAAAESAPASVAKVLAAKLEPTLDGRGGPMEYQLAAKLHWKAGDKGAAVASAKKAVEAADSELGKKMNLGTEPFKRYADSLEKGTLPSDSDFHGWLREARNAQPKAGSGN